MKNFASYVEAEYSFVTGKTVMIYGKNFDDLGSDSNGSGKSNFVKAIKICLLDIPDRELGQEDYINENSQDSILELELRNELIKVDLRIVRKYKRTTSGKVFIYENGVLNENLTSISEANKRIIELIGISKEDLLDYFIISQDNSNSFLLSTDSEKKKIISRFINIDSIQKICTEIDFDVKFFEDEILKIEKTEILYNSSIMSIEEQIEFEKNGRKNNVSEKADELIILIENEKENILKIEKEIQKKEKSIVILEEQLKQFQLLTFEEKKNKLIEIEKYNEGIQNKRIKEKKLRNELKLIEQGKIVCPKCRFIWSTIDETFDFKNIEIELKNCETKIEKLDLILQKNDEITKKINKEIEKIKENNEIHFTHFNNVKIEKEDILLLGKSLQNSKKIITTYKTNLQDLKKYSVDKKRIKELNEKIEDINDCIVELNVLKEQLIQEKNDLLFWKNNFSLSGFQSYLINKTLQNFEGYINYFLKKFETNLVVKINGFKKLKSGKVSEEIDVLISKDGTNWNKFKRFSGGQKGRINVCGILTLQKFMNLNSKSGGLDLLILDEFFEGLDVSGQQKVLSILEKSNTTTFVVSHHNYDIGCKYKMNVEMKNNESRII